jgi:predicted ATPase
MLALYRSGRQAEALAAYREARSALDELGIAPSEELRRLEAQILRQEATLRPAVRTTNLPAEPTPLIGRTRELAAILELVRANRLVTLTGAGGSGKTRLALEAARGLLDDFADGVWFVSLASLSDPELVEPTIAQTLGARGELNDFLGGKHLLLLLDNLEQLLPEASAIVADLDAKVLATSRERLNVSAEHEYAVPTLPLDDAVTLFTQRAQQLRARFQSDDHVTELARRLDGLPLALELAAARVKLLTPRQIVERLGESLDLLSGGGRDRPERQRTLRATLEWSHDLLRENEQKLFARLGVFAASFDVQMAEAVADAGLDDLQSLVDKSLLQKTSDERLVMLDTLRSFSRERLEAEELEPLRRRLFDVLLERAEQLPEATTGDWLVWFDEIDLLLPDVREALHSALGRDPVGATRLICRLRAFWGHRGRMRECLSWLERALAHRGALPDEVLAEAFRAVGCARLLLNDPEGAAEPFRESIELFNGLGDRIAAANVTSWYAQVLSSRGAHAHALALREQVLRELREVGHELAVNATILEIGDSLRELGEYTRARTTLDAGLALAEARGDSVAIGVACVGLANLALDQLRVEDAEALFERALAIVRGLRNPPQIAICFAGLACVAALHGELFSSGERWGRAEFVEEQTGTRLLRWERGRYEQIVVPVENDGAFRRGYEEGRAAEAASAEQPTPTTIGA